MTRKFGLIGKSIDYSFSRTFFSEKFLAEGIDATYENFDLDSIIKAPEVFKQNLSGLNITIPYKERIIPYLDDLHPNAKAIGAVNTIQFKDGKLIGFNTDYYGFTKAIKSYLKPHHKKALILGTGGASKAIAFALDLLNITYELVSRNPDFNELVYNDIDDDLMSSFPLIINCTPLGTHPNIDRKPDIPYEYINHKHLLFDLIYNPSETTFLKLGKEQGASISNGLKMLEYQAEEAWRIWND